MYFKIKYGYFRVDLDGVIELDLSTKQLNIRIKNGGENIVIENSENGKKYLYSYSNLPSKYKVYYRYAAKLVKTVKEESKNEIKIEDKNGVFSLDKNGEFKALLKGMTSQESIEVKISRDREVSIRTGDFRNREGSSYYGKMSPHYNKFASLAEFYKTKCQQMKDLK